MARRKARLRTTGSDGTTFAQRLAHAHDAEKLARLEQQLVRTRGERDVATRLVGDLRARVDLLERVDAIRPTPPVWSRGPRGKGKLHHGIPTLILSDTHWDEVVRPQEVEGVNAYSRKIAELRMRALLKNTIEVTRTYFQGLTYDGFVCLLGGDLLSGGIHEELVQTNEDTVLGSLDHWAEQLAAFLLALREEFGQLHVYGVVGNHGRLTRKPRAKLRVRDSLDWLLYRVTRSATESRGVGWTINESADVDVPIYSTTFRLTHGDQFRGGGGIAGILSPLMLGHHRKARRQNALRKPFDWLVMGHWHEYLHGRGLIVNGTLKGYDEFSYVSNFVPEPPCQALWITTPERGATFPAQVFCQDRKAEGW